MEGVQGVGSIDLSSYHSLSPSPVPPWGLEPRSKHLDIIRSPMATEMSRHVDGGKRALQRDVGSTWHSLRGPDSRHGTTAPLYDAVAEGGQGWPRAKSSFTVGISREKEVTNRERGALALVLAGDPAALQHDLHGLDIRGVGALRRQPELGLGVNPVVYVRAF
ncbi:hypothetical protein AXG93_4905s1350 [Marchantia polymorpha subsp. ruderalis]|uniref:Uncharacterized protein n=1 Tax=Marchantia polymorpha subsp. ruderalis TaxID=1480154 RepID=A0A176VKG0_MARPO|nr:hypothetical protein AXG93_4905s1350 [Marchantia polymorpha subsp. ruderalis]